MFPHTFKQSSSLSHADPFFERERIRYAHPIASRDYIQQVIAEAGGTINFQQLAQRLAVPQEQQVALQKRLRAMEQDGQLLCNTQGCWQLISPDAMHAGLVRGNKDGSGKCIMEDASGAIYLPPMQMRKVFDGDRVLVLLGNITVEGERQGIITEIIERNTSSIIGYCCCTNGSGYVEPRNKRIHHRILVEQFPRDVQNGDLVEIAITSQPQRNTRPAGRIVQNLTHAPAGETSKEIDIALLTHNLHTQWNADTQQQLALLNDFPQGEYHSNRKDVRNLAFVTIDGDDSKDFDDAVCCVSTSSGWKLFVAVADVSYYVPVDSPLDRQARVRGTSVYFPSEVIPMLPERLSNDLCSLKPHCDRPVLVCEIELSRAGISKDFTVYQAVMHSHARLTYEQVNRWITTPSQLFEGNVAITKNLRQLLACYTCLARQRDKRGALSIEIPETAIAFADGTQIQAIHPKQRGIAHKMIEEAMVLANSLVAQLLMSHSLAVLYRVHWQPETTKVDTFRTLVQTITSITLGGKDQPATSDFNQVIKKLANHQLGEYLVPLILRTMPQAFYSPNNTGHYGLALTNYCHFTSPIRRYPDLLIHRALKALIATATNRQHLPDDIDVMSLQSLEKLYPYDINTIRMLGVRCSAAEQRANEASFEVLNHLCCQFFLQCLGDVFDGTIRSVTSFGIFVEIGKTNVDGLVHVSQLSRDYYHFDAKSLCLCGKHSGRCFRLGDKVQVTVASVDIERKKIDLHLVNASNRQVLDEKNPRRKSPKSRNKKR